MNIVKQEQEAIADEADVTFAAYHPHVGSSSNSGPVQPPSHQNNDDEQMLLSPDGITHSLPYTKYGPYFCPRCLGRFEKSQKFAAHMQLHYRHETKEETSLRHALKYRNRFQGQIARLAPGGRGQVAASSVQASSSAAASALALALAPSAEATRYVGLTLHQIRAFARRSAAPTPTSATLDAIQVKQEVQVKDERMWD